MRNLSEPGPADVLHTCGAWCPVGEPRLCLAFGTKFSLLGFLVVRTVQNSPCMQKKRQIEPFRASGESFVPEVGPCDSCWESFVPHMRRGQVCRESFEPHMRRGQVCRESFEPHMRRGQVCRESFVPKRQGVVVVGRIMPCSGVVLVPVGRLWRRPGAAAGLSVPPAFSTPVAVGVLQH